MNSIETVQDFEDFIIEHELAGIQIRFFNREWLVDVAPNFVTIIEGKGKYLIDAMQDCVAKCLQYEKEQG